MCSQPFYTEIFAQKGARPIPQRIGGHVRDALCGRHMLQLELALPQLLLDETITQINMT